MERTAGGFSQHSPFFCVFLPEERLREDVYGEEGSEEQDHEAALTDSYHYGGAFRLCRRRGAVRAAHGHDRRRDHGTGSGGPALLGDPPFDLCGWI